VNTCTVTSTADAKSRQAVRRARRASPDGTVLVAGCSVQVDPAAFVAVDAAARLVRHDADAALLAELDELLRLPGVGAMAGPIDDGLPSGGADRDGDATDGRRLASLGALRERAHRARASRERALPEGALLGRALPTLSGVESVSFDGVADERASVERTRAFVKVQDGCSFFCTYCIIPRARGAERSLPPDAVLADVRRAVAAGHREVVLTGINVGTYDGGASERGRRGSHAWSALTLAGLVRRILAETDVERIRLSSIEPQHVDEELLDAWTSDPARCLPHLHLPLQSGDDGVLRRMGRRYDTAAYARVVERARRAIPGLAVHADVIAGFPTEDEAAWRRSVAFIRSLDLAGLHVFRYSARAGTPATRMAGQVDEPTRKRRATELGALGVECRTRFARRRLGASAAVLFESRLPDGRWVGHAEDHLLVAAAPPDDGPGSLENAIGRVLLAAVDADTPWRLDGTLVSLDPARRLPLPPVDGPRAAASRPEIAHPSVGVPVGGHRG
jgi:threonylcarbamoyladenosine tRNA methylthiotransferase MtaB